MSPAALALGVLSLLLLAAVNTVGFTFIVAMIFGGSPKLALRLRRSTKHLIVAAAVVQVAVVLSASSLVADRHALVDEVAQIRAEIASLQVEMKQQEEIVTASTVPQLFAEMEHLTKAHKDLEHAIERHLEDYKSRMEQMQYEIQFLQPGMEARRNVKATASNTTNYREQGKEQKIRHLVLDDIMKAFQVQAAKVQQVKIRFPWEKLKKAKNLYSKAADVLV